MGIDGWRHNPGRFTPWKDTRYPLYRRLGGPQSRSGRLWKISPRTIQPIVSRYTNYAELHLIKFEHWRVVENFKIVAMI
jgi:hypothetical protein